VRSYVELLLDCPPESQEERSEFLHIIDAETHRLSRMIDDLLDLARLNAGSMVWNMSEVNLGRLIKKVVTQLKPMMQRDEIEHVIDVPSDLPRVWGDADRLAQVLINLLDNAIKHTHGGTITLSARMVSEAGTNTQVEDFAELVVADTGRGIPPDKLEAVFERFEQVHEDEEDGAGAGLGLSICREIVNHHGGRIWAEASEEGARLVLRLPLAGHLDVISGTYDTGGDEFD